jgi:hypothetical protein
VAVEPYIVDGDIPIVGQAVPPGIAVVAVDAIGNGLTPGEAISVEPSGIPVPPTGALGTMPSGEVTDSEGIGVTAAWAKAASGSNGSAASKIKSRFIAFSISDLPSGSQPIRRCHELRTDRIGDRLTQDAVDLDHRGIIDAPTENIRYRRELVFPACTPEGDVRIAAIEHPAGGEMNDAFRETLLREAIQPLDGGEVLCKTRRTKLRISLAQIIADKAAG